MMGGMLLLSAALLGAGVPLPLQGEDTPSQARNLLQQAVVALGGDAFRNLQTRRIEGKLYSFSRGGLSGLADVVEYIRYPDKRREEYGKDKETVVIINGQQGWTVDIHGVKAASAEEMKDYWEAESMSAFYILRYRLDEPGSTLEYGGRDLWEHREVDRVRFIDAENRTATFFLDPQTHLPLRVAWARRDPQTRERMEEVEILFNYFTQQGVTAPRYVSRERNGTRIYEAFIREIQYNLGLADSLFTAPRDSRR